MRKLFVALLFLLAGCVGNRDVPSVQYYVLSNGAETATARLASQRSAPVLLVHPTVVNTFYDTQRLVYSRAEGQRAYYQFAAWTERPGRAFTELLSRRLGASTTTSGVRGDVTLHTRLEELYHDAAAKPGSVKIAVSAELIDSATRTVVAKRTLTRTVPTNSENAAGAVEAANRAVAEVLDEIAAWVEGSQPRPAAT